MTKKILFVETQSEFGGAQRFIYTLIRGLKGYEIVVAAGIEGDDERGLLRALEKKGISTRRLKYLRRGINLLFDFCLGIIEIYRLIKKEKPDVLFLCSSKAGALGGLAGRLANAPKIIYRIGGWTFNDPWPKWKKKIYIWIEKLTARFKDIIINNAKSDTEQAIKLGIKPKKEILTIYNGVDIKILDLEFLNRNEARGRLNLGDLDFIIGTIATLYPTKGLKYLIEAAHLLKDKNIKFILVGEGQEKEEIENLIKNYNLSEKFVLIKPTYKDYIYLKAFDAFVLPSLKEGFPWTILEAMVAEVPVIATRVGAIPEVIDNGKNGILIDSRNPEQTKQAINKLLDDESLRNKLAKEGRKTVVEKFNLEKMVKEIEKLF